MRFSSCIDMMFSGMTVSEKIKAVSECGLNAVEFWKWTDKDIEEIEFLLKKYKLGFSVFNIDSSNGKLSADLSRGILNSGRKDDFLSALYESVPIYRRLNAAGMIVLIGETLPDVPYEAQLENIYKCLKAAAPITEKNGVNLVVEPLNASDRKNYFLPKAAPLFGILERVGSPNIKMLYDIYHQNMTGDFSIAAVRKNIDGIGHFHIADFPGRHEPGTGTLDYPSIIREIGKTAYNGYIGLEYRATKPDCETLGFLEGLRGV